MAMFWRPDDLCAGPHTRHALNSHEIKRLAIGLKQRLNFGAARFIQGPAVSRMTRHMAQIHGRENGRANALMLAAGNH